MSHIKDIKSGIKREQVYGGNMVASCDENEHASFSWQACELCGSTLGGERHGAALIYPGTNKEPIKYSVCQCCLLYLANGDICDCEN